MTVYGNSFYLCSLAYPQQTQKCYNPKVVHFPFSSTSSSCPSLTFPAFACPGTLSFSLSECFYFTLFFSLPRFFDMANWFRFMLM
uniref:Uncharacterized protein n=1 Tax=Rhizophora mucronata TaxID=61149 RepID=A0A2P2KPC7_RHIMU